MILTARQIEMYRRTRNIVIPTRVCPKVSGLSRQRNKQQTLVEKQHKGLWRQNSLDGLTK
jgi:hypothetical protein